MNANQALNLLMENKTGKGFDYSQLYIKGEDPIKCPETIKNCKRAIKAQRDKGARDKGAEVNTIISVISQDFELNEYQARWVYFNAE